MARTFERKLVRQAAGVTLQDFSASNAQLKLEVNASVATASLGADASTEQREALLLVTRPIDHVTVVKSSRHSMDNMP